MTFIASNGVEVRLNPSPYGQSRMPELEILGEGQTSPTRMTIHDSHLKALAEYFEALRDAELDRWRDPEEPHMVVYRNASRDDNDGRCVIVVDEKDGSRYLVWEGLLRTPTTARYFAAHPAPHPWKDAQPGELWEITLAPDDTRRAISRGYGRFTDLHGVWWEPAEITAASRLYPPEED